MGTRSLIRVKGCKEGIYCHWDGYPSNNGDILFNHFKTKRKAKKLLELGNISSLGQKIRAKKGHSYDAPVKNTTVAYHRDRGEDFDMGENYGGVEYIYEFKNSRWYVDLGNGDGFEVLTKEIIENN